MVITGTRSGLGRLLAEHYAVGGFQVVGCSRRPPETALANYEHVTGDVADESAVKALFGRARELGRVAAVLNNAGASTANHALLTPAATVREVLETTILGTFLCAREGAKAMRRTGGSIVNFSSVHVPLATVGTSVYGAAKSAVEQFTRVFAKEVAGLGIAVNCIGLPPVRGTGMYEALPAVAADKLRQRLAVVELDVDAVVAALDPLLRPGTPALTGQTIYLGGV